MNLWAATLRFSARGVLILYVLQPVFENLYVLPRPQVFAQNSPSLAIYCPRLAYSAMNAGKCRMMSNPTVWLSIPVKPLRSTTTCKCCIVCQMHVRPFNPCVTFHVFRNSQTSLFCLQAQSHWTVQQYWIAQQNEVHPASLVPTRDNNR